jgi:hypothetical protein
MVGFLVRFLGLVLMAAGFVGLVIDATGSIANGQATFTPLGEVGQSLFPGSFGQLEPAVSRNAHPIVWDPVLVTLFKLPAAITGFALGALFLWLGRRRPEPIGYQADP